MTADDLRNAETAFQAAFSRSEQLREERNEAIRRAVREGWTHAQIAEATGLTRARVGQLALP